MTECFSPDAVVNLRDPIDPSVIPKCIIAISHIKKCNWAISVHYASFDDDMFASLKKFINKQKSFTTFSDACRVAMAACDILMRETDLTVTVLINYNADTYDYHKLTEANLIQLSTLFG